MIKETTDLRKRLQNIGALKSASVEAKMKQNQAIIQMLNKAAKSRTTLSHQSRVEERHQKRCPRHRCIEGRLRIARFSTNLPRK